MRGDDVAFQDVRFVHLARRAHRVLMARQVERRPGLLSRAPQAERQALAALTQLALEIVDEPTHAHGLHVGVVVELRKQGYIRRLPAHRAEDDQVSLALRGLAQALRPVEAVQDGEHGIVRRDRRQLVERVEGIDVASSRILLVFRRFANKKRPAPEYLLRRGPLDAWSVRIYADASPNPGAMSHDDKRRARGLRP